MAEEIQIAGTESTAKVRNPLGVVGLSLITLGVYFFFWWYFINREMRDLGRARNVDLGQNPGNSVLAITLGALIIVPAIVTMWTTSARIENAQEAVGLERRVSGPVVFILLLLIGPVGIWYAQSELNKAWAAQGRPVPRRRPCRRRNRARRPLEVSPHPLSRSRKRRVRGLRRRAGRNSLRRQARPGPSWSVATGPGNRATSAGEDTDHVFDQPPSDWRRRAPTRPRHRCRVRDDQRSAENPPVGARSGCGRPAGDVRVGATPRNKEGQWPTRRCSLDGARS